MLWGQRLIIVGGETGEGGSGGSEPQYHTNLLVIDLQEWYSLKHIVAACILDMGIEYASFA